MEVHKLCEFLSWIEKNGQVYFLNYNDIYHTRRGKELRDYCNNTGDYIGHGAIRFFYDNFSGGADKECIDFSTSRNFPLEIANAIKNGEFRGLGLSAQLLTLPAYAEYKKIQQLAYAEYKKIQQLAYAEYEKIQQLAYEKIQQPAYAEYKKIQQPAYAEYKKIQHMLFWDIFDVRKNRNKLWR